MLGLYVNVKVAGISGRRECSRWRVFVVTDLGWCWLPCRILFPLCYPIRSMCSSAHHVIMIIACYRIRCTVCIFTYTLASYRIACGSASGSARGTDWVRSTRNPGIGGARGRWERRGSSLVCGPPTQFLRTRQAPEHSKSPTS
jgi:hypothetical protein